MTLEEQLIRFAQELSAKTRLTQQRLSALEQSPPPADDTPPDGFMVRQNGEWRTAGLTQMKGWLKSKRKKVVNITIGQNGQNKQNDPDDTLNKQTVLKF